MLVEESLGRLAPHHEIRDRVGVTLVGVTDLPDTGLKLHAASLLDDVGGFMRGGMQARRAGKRDVLPRRERLGAHRLCRMSCARVAVSLDRADIVAPEQLLDGRQMRQRGTSATGATRGRLVDHRCVVTIWC
jgi:hypothetical protein